MYPAICKIKIVYCVVAVFILPRCSSQKELNFHQLSINGASLTQIKRGSEIANYPDLKEIRKDELPNFTYIHQPHWLDNSIKLGSVSAVSLDKYGNLVVFHRADRIWNEHTFNGNKFTQKDLGPITNHTIIAVDRKFGKIVNKCGRNLFYMPHGLTVDHEDNIWVTDVALHQVMKLSPNCTSDKPSLVLGTAFVPGQGSKFCKPTSVAVLSNGEFFVADGYCNARILKFLPNGKFVLSWGANTFQGEAHEVAPPNFFAIPHGLTLVNDEQSLCVADRENGRVQCFYTSNGTFHSQYHNSIIGDRLFSVDFAPIEGGKLFVINGPEYVRQHEVRGYVIDMLSSKIVSSFGPYNNTQFANPHDISVTVDGNEIYVAELDPPRVHKFLSRKHLIDMSTVTTNSILVTEPTINERVKKHNGNLLFSTVFYIVFLTIIILLIISAIFLLILKRWRRGNSEISSNSDVEYSKLVTNNACEE